MALGRIHEQGIGTAVDLGLACQYYERAAQKNVPYALYRMGNIHEQGLHPTVKGEMKWAFMFYKRAVDLAVEDKHEQCNEALYKLGYFYQHGIEVEKNLQ